MNISATKCDECPKIKGEANHWHQIGIQKYANGVWIELGVIGCHSDPRDVDAGYEVRDLCCDQCLKDHIMRLLRVTTGEQTQ